jgi:hypothetical protein
MNPHEEYLQALRDLAEAITRLELSQRLLIENMRLRAYPLVFYPPQGEPGGDPEAPLTRAEADERERSSHTHPTS